MVIGIVIFYLDSYTNHGQKIEVPNLVGKNISSIQSILEELDLEFEVVEVKYDPKKIKGTILDQDPKATLLSDVYVKEGRVIRLKISKSTDLVEMPDLISKSERFALQVLKNRGLKYEIEYKKSTESDGAVLNQKFKGKTIKSGVKLPIGSVIILVIGRNEGGEPIQIPNLYGLTLEEAKALVGENNGITFFPICPDCINATDSINARIESQVPEFIDGILSPYGSSVTVYATPNFVDAR
jgi:beta-lactam-binding protein with PASTA domain